MTEVLSSSQTISKDANFRFSGHQTFPLRIAWIPKAVAEISLGNDPLTDIDEGITVLGLGKNMVEALRCWVEAFQIAKRVNSSWELSPIGERVQAVFRDLAGVPVDDDGITFDMSDLRVEDMQERDEDKGVRLSFIAKMANVRVSMKVDVGFGDVVTPGPIELDYPAMLDLPTAKVRAYPVETVIAEKFQAMVELGMRNSRMKDFFDLWAIATTLDVDGAALASALRATFDKRETELPTSPPLALTAEFVDDAAKQTQWSAFIRRTTTTQSPASLKEAVELISQLVMPAATAGTTGQTWRAGGPWS